METGSVIIAGEGPSKKTVFLVFLSLLIVAAAAFYSSIWNDFAFDDHLAIGNNKDTLSTTPLIDIWGNDIWGKNLRAIDSHRSYRPLLIMLFKGIRIMNERYFSSVPLPMTYRVISIASHTVASTFVYILGLRLLKCPQAAWGAAILFAAHPVHVEAVAAVVNMAEALHSIFYISAFLIYDNSILRRIGRWRVKDAPTEEYDTLTDFLWLVLEAASWLLCLVVSVLLKETGLTVVGIILAQSAIALLRFFWWHGSSIKSEQEEIGPKTFLSLLMLYGPWVGLCILGIVLYFFLRMMTQGYSPIRVLEVFRRVGAEFLVAIPRYFKDFKGGSATADSFPSLRTIKSSFYLEESELIRKAENPFAFLKHPQERFLSFAYLHFRYFLTLLYPAQLCAEYAFNCIPAVSNFSDPRNLYSAALYSITILAGGIGLFGAISDRGCSSTCAVLLNCIIWLVIPFVPASGLLLRLGTLLAERLLYVPSIGFCMLLSLFLKKTIGKYGARLNALVIFAIATAYCLKASRQNLVWKDDSTLFLESLKVCPNSAKNQLQVAKLMLNRGDYSSARVHVDRAMEIDPTFCDAGYQDALIKLFLEKDIKAAMEAAADNLSCVFTNMHSWELLQKLWEQQLQEAPNNPHVLAMHGDMAVRGGMHAFACKKYTAAASAAFEVKLYSLALDYCVQAEKTVPKFMQDAKPGDLAESTLALRDLRCFVEMLCGATRTHVDALLSQTAIASKNEKKGKRADKLPKLSSSQKRLLPAGIDMLQNAMRTECAIIDKRGKVVGSNAVAAATSLSRVVTPNVTIPFGDESFLRSPEFASEAGDRNFERYAKYLSAAADLYHHVAAHGGVGGEASASVFLDRVPETRLLAIFLWSLLGQRSLAIGRYSEAADRLRMAITWGVGSISVSPGVLWAPAHIVSSGVTTTAAGDVDLDLDVETLAHRAVAPCSIIYWLAHAIFGSEEEKETASALEGIKTVSALLKTFLSCQDKPEALYRSPQDPKEANELRIQATELLKELSSVEINTA